MTRAVVLSLFVLVTYVSCNLIKTDQSIGTKDVPIPREDVDNNDLKPAAPLEIDTDILPLAMDREPKKCAKIGEFCTNHSECCTRSCLGYAKRCVSGSGLYPEYIDLVDPPAA